MRVCVSSRLGTTCLPDFGVSLSGAILFFSLPRDYNGEGIVTVDMGLQLFITFLQ
jgi:hypothetical protein